MRAKIFNALLILTSLIGYLEWGTNNHSFLFQAESEVFSKLISDPTSVVHPFILLPFFGQIILFITLFQKSPNKIMTWLGMCGLGLLLGFMFIIGIIGANFKTILSTIPFLVVSVLTIRHLQKT